MAQATLNPALKDFWLTPARNRVLYGGRASSKSWDAAGFAVFLAQKYCIRVLCCRQFQNKISESVYTLIKKQIDRFGLKDQFIITDKSIRHAITGSEFLFYGLWRSIDEVKSLEGVDICWLEEAHSLTKEQWKILDPTIRQEGSQFWIIFNPNLASDFVYKRFVTNTPPNTVKRMINYTENPFLSETMLNVIEAAKQEDYEEYQHVYLGVPREDDDNVVIKRTWVMAAIDAHIKLGIEPSGAKTGSLDVADEGIDKNAFCGAHGILVNHIEQWSGVGGDIFKTTERAFKLCDLFGYESFKYDADGLGAGVRGDARVVNESRKNKIDVMSFRGSDGVINPEKEDTPGRKNKDFFQNCKSQSWWSLRMRFQKTYQAVVEGKPVDPDEIISLSSNLTCLGDLVEELPQARWSVNQVGKIIIDKKPGGTKSPNLADAVMIQFSQSNKQKLKISPELLAMAKTRRR